MSDTTPVPAASPRLIDLVEMEIFREIVTSVLDEIETNLTRTAYSPYIYEYKDYTVGLLTPEFSLINQSRRSLPMFIADLGAPVEDAVAQIGIENLAPGDVFITNYAAVQGQHLNNVVMGTPVFDGEVLSGYVAIRAHWADVGGLVAGSTSWNATEVYQEGVQFRGLRVMERGRLRREVVETVLANSRMRDYVQGDLMAQLGCCLLAQQRWTERVASRWSIAEVNDIRAREAARSAEFAREQIAALPDGTYRATCLSDDSGVPGTDPMHLVISIEIDGDQMVVDLSEMPPQVAAPINTGSAGGGRSMVRLVFKALLASDYPLSEGLFEPLEVRIPPGTFLSAAPDAPMAYWNNSLAIVGDLVAKALAEAAPELAPASHHGAMNLHAFSGKREDGRWWQLRDTLGGGWGGSQYGDGFSPLKTNHHGDNREIPAEIVEARFPLRILSWGYAPDTAGDGTHRGGLGIEKVIRVERPVLFNSAMDRSTDPPWGTNGGTEGVPGDITIVEGDTTRSARKVTDVKLAAGTIVRVRSGGGGGWGPPKDRADEARALDRLKGFVTTDED